jgi:hypothetical protein
MEAHVRSQSTQDAINSTVLGHAFSGGREGGRLTCWVLAPGAAPRLRSSPRPRPLPPPSYFILPARCSPVDACKVWTGMWSLAISRSDALYCSALLLASFLLALFYAAAFCLCFCMSLLASPLPALLAVGSLCVGTCVIGILYR